MPIPAIWPTPNNPDTRVRVFRIEVERPVTGYPTLTCHMQEAVEVGTTSFLNYRPDIPLSIGLADALADPELHASAAAVASGLEEIAYTLYLRKKAELEPAPAPPEG